MGFEYPLMYITFSNLHQPTPTLIYHSRCINFISIYTPFKKYSIKVRKESELNSFFSNTILFWKIPLIYLYTVCNRMFVHSSYISFIFLSFALFLFSHFLFLNNEIRWKFILMNFKALNYAVSTFFSGLS